MCAGEVSIISWKKWLKYEWACLQRGIWAPPQRGGGNPSGYDLDGIWMASGRFLEGEEKTGAAVSVGIRMT